MAFSLHTFTDASAVAYGAVIYPRCQSENGKSSIKLIRAKSKVVPLLATNIPQIELLDVVLGLRLSCPVLETYKVDFKAMD